MISVRDPKIRYRVLASWACPVSFYSYRADSKTHNHSLDAHKVQMGDGFLPLAYRHVQHHPSAARLLEFQTSSPCSFTPLVSSSRPLKLMPAASCWTIGSHFGIIVLGGQNTCDISVFLFMNDVRRLCGSREASSLLLILGHMRTH